MTKDETLKSEIEEVMNSLIKQAEEERLKDPNYKELFKKSTDFENLLRETQNKMNSVILDSFEVLQKKFGVKKIDNEVYSFFLALPLLEDLVKKRIQQKQGNSCCVDKTYYLLSNMLKTKLKEESA